MGQFAAALAWYAASRPEGLSFNVLKVPILHWLAFFVLVACGQVGTHIYSLKGSLAVHPSKELEHRIGAVQVLNAGIYKAIGVDGVYYGTKLDKKVPWVTGFPFSVVSHPQYVGSVMTVIGVTVLLWTQGPPGLLKVATFWCSLYGITALQEQYL